MTYFGFLAVFVVLPILGLWAVALWDTRRGIGVPAHLRSWHAHWIVLAHVIVAVLYTTPWDNYLVATRVWWYAPELVTGLLIGYVPIEEYTFFVLMTLLTGSWLLLVVRHKPEQGPAPRQPVRFRQLSTLLLFGLWLIFVAILIFGWRPGTYMALLFAWALPPIMLQTAFGADILWRYRRALLLTIVPMTLYLSAADKLAISSGTWTINPEQTVNVLLLGRLPIEEFLFFFIVNVLIAFGMTLVMSVESKARAGRYVVALRNLLSRKQAVEIGSE
ncbi:MAG: lycopene cyclase domain-containing protein [Candidatus Thermofonsia Clade 1 bacterium]|jgi:lycopene cyclase domain-containing protein|uniref:Lycopene cyclase domain-containing protein n=1 Tax=Candidatus Thermofonsia Clade 1 bacterium TaxID=2364210 RepID=A0A2M8PDL1_9CHLR|nr:MAG: lycopene cyclase domain-containing protein [Candidatus Thermofonsia Clade 1 bacterium]RMF48924.1 MAG: lycopene cyclase domain-containing protein [Chloroflexota bacterium]